MPAACWHFGLNPIRLHGLLDTGLRRPPPGLAPGMGPSHPNTGRVHLVFFIPFMGVIKITLCMSSCFRSVNQGSVVVKQELSLWVMTSLSSSRGHKLWVVTKRIRLWVQVVELRFHSRVGRLTPWDKVMIILGIVPMLIWIDKGQIRWFRHLKSMPKSRFLLELYQTCSTWQRPRGRPRICWRDYISQLDWERLGISQEEPESVAVDR